MRTEAIGAALGLVVGASACSFQRSAVVSRNEAARLGPRVIVADADGEARDARVTRVRPLRAAAELPDYYPEAQDAPLLSRAAPRAEVIAAWERDPGWQDAEASLDVVEPSGTWAVVGGAAVGAALAALTAYALTACTASESQSCEDSDTIRAGAFFLLVPVGALVGGVGGGALHQLFGGSSYRIVEQR